MASSPLIWALTGGRRGDNAQVMALAAAVAAVTGGKVIEKPLCYNALRLLPNILIQADITVLDKARSAPLAPPWPDLVIAAGRRSVPVARWIRAQSGGRAKLVQLGRPRAPLAWFDLVVTTAQYGLPSAGNVVMLDLPPAVDAAPMEDAQKWRERFSDLPRPWIGVLVGGARWPVLFDAEEAKRLGRTVERLRAQTGGSWIVSTSPRTGLRQARALHEMLTRPGFFHYWREGAGVDNPHRAVLALADCFVVTADSASMIAEAVRTGKSVSLFRPGRSRFGVRWKAQDGPARWLAERGILSPPRDMEAFCTRLVEARAAQWCEETGLSPDSSGWRESRLEEAVGRIVALLGA